MAALAPTVTEKNQNHYGVSSNNRFDVYPQRKVIKYTKLRDSDTNEPWITNNYPQHPRQRCIATFQEVDVGSIAPKPIFTGKLMSSSFTRRKVVAISEDEKNDLHPKFHSRETLPSAKSNVSNKKEVKKSKFCDNNKSPKNMHISVNKNRINKKETDLLDVSKVSLLKNSNKPSTPKTANEIDLKVKSTRTFLRKKIDEIPRHKKLSQKPKARSLIMQFPCKRQPSKTIHVPLENESCKTSCDNKTHDVISQKAEFDKLQNKKVSEMEDIPKHSDINVEKNPEPPEINHSLTEHLQLKPILNQEECFNGEDPTCRSNLKELFDSLDIPNVTLTKEKTDPCKHDLNYPPQCVTPNTAYNIVKDPGLSKSSPCIIGRATLTYTTEQKFDFHVVGSESDDRTVHFSPKTHLAYPLSVLSIFRKEISKNDHCDFIADDKKRNASDDEFTNCLNKLKSLNCSDVVNSHKLVKPSDIIRSLKVNSGLFVNDYICEQFQRELNFIDSFFESLQFLDSCSLAEKCLAEGKVENWASESNCAVQNSEYASFFTTIENGAVVDVTETMVSKSLCLLNLLIRDEQRRAKNLLFVLKMREAALKDFTKSQILWLENKKKQDKTDIPTLKKKQRGALLKLQHECGEMQRMRKALLALSEKRKVALMKTKKNIELNLNNHVHVNQLLLGKRKLKRNQSSLDRNIAPLKCFDLSSSGCEETARAKCDLLMNSSSVTCFEKCVQTSDSVLGSLLVNKTSDAAAEDCVTVDGGYLNIIFHNLSLPRIFSSGKQYEVDEKALINIVNSTNSLHKLNENDAVDKIAEEKTRDLDRSSSPSTARSLVEEFDQYYKGLVEVDQSSSESAGSEKNLVRISESDIDNRSDSIYHDTSYGSSNCDLRENVTFATFNVEGEVIVPKVAGPLTVPAGAAAEDDQPDVDPTWNDQKLTAPIPEVSAPSSMPSLNTVSSTSLVEAEELRRQQVEIEREIKALEQQQCQLLVVREIPDKPPPPYTPPSDVRPKQPLMFLGDQPIETKIYAFIKGGVEPDHEEPFDMFLKDYCDDAVQKITSLKSDKPWESCNLLPQKPMLDDDELVDNTRASLKDALTVVVNSGHIDDILFAEWRRCEPEWTAHHIDEAVVKNQIFESIFQKTLTETIDQYKKIVLNNN